MLSDHVKTGMQQTPHRSLFNALGFTLEEMKRPFVSVIFSYNEIVSGHTNLGKTVDVVKPGVAEAGGMPVVMPAIAVCDGITMGHTGMKYSLVMRDLITDSTECLARAYQFDVIVRVPNCDKNVPGLLMTVARVDTPTIFVSGGPMLTSHMRGGKRSFSGMLEAAGAYVAGKMTADNVAELEEKACPTCGNCSGMYATNSLNCLTEVLGMGLRSNGTIPTVYSKRLYFAKHIGDQIVELYRKNIRPRDIMTEDAFANALTADMILDYSTSAMLHLPAIIREVKVSIDVNVANKVSARTPNLCHLILTDRAHMEDLDEASGAYAVMRELSEKNPINFGCLTTTGRTAGGNIEYARNLDPEIIRPVEEPYSAAGGVAILNGSIVLEPCVMKRSAVVPEMSKYSGSARVFDCENDAITAIKGGKIVPDDAAAIRYKGPKGGLGVRGMLNPTSVIVGMGPGSTVTLVTDGRLPGASRGASIGHVAPGTTVGGPTALIREGDIIDIGIDSHALNIRIFEEEFTGRKKNWKPCTNEVDGYLVRYREPVTGAPQGAVLSVEG